MRLEKDMYRDTLLKPGLFGLCKDRQHSNPNNFNSGTELAPCRMPRHLA